MVGTYTSSCCVNRCKGFLIILKFIINYMWCAYCHIIIYSIHFYADHSSFASAFMTQLKRLDLISAIALCDLYMFDYYTSMTLNKCKLHKLTIYMSSRPSTVCPSIIQWDNSYYCVIILISSWNDIELAVTNTSIATIKAYMLYMCVYADGPFWTLSNLSIWLNGRRAETIYRQLTVPYTHTLGTLHEHIIVTIQRVYILWYVQVYYMYKTYICAYYVFSTYVDANNSGLMNSIIITIQTFILY